MKDNKKFTKLLLASLSVVLVIGISVSATLAYLTATTQVKENNFHSASDVTGQVLEPSYTTDVNYQPGDIIHKDPLIDNDTEQFPIFVGAKLSFSINVTGTTYTPVSYETFKKYAVMRTDSDKTFTEALNGNWTKLNAASDGNLYVYYNNSIAADTSAGESDPNAKGHGGSAGTDATDATARTTVNPDGPSADDVYEKFNIKIFIDGYGVMNAAGAANITTAAIDEIKTNLGYTAA